MTFFSGEYKKDILKVTGDQKSLTLLTFTEKKNLF